jgi:hypothetical protein
MLHQTIAAEVPAYDCTICVSDDWAFVMRGEHYAEALFAVTEEQDSYCVPRGHGMFSECDYTLKSAKLIGVTAEDSDQITFYDRDAVTAMFASERVLAWESLMNDELNDF